MGWFLGRSREAAWAIQRLTEFTRDYQEIGQGIPIWVSVTALVRRAAEFFPGDGVAIVAPDEEWEIRADPLIEQVFYNLIENALRHGGHGRAGAILGRGAACGRGSDRLRGRWHGRARQ